MDYFTKLNNKLAIIQRNNRVHIILIIIILKDHYACNQKGFKYLPYYI